MMAYFSPHSLQPPQVSRCPRFGRIDRYLIGFSQLLVMPTCFGALVAHLTCLQFVRWAIRPVALICSGTRMEHQIRRVHVQPKAGYICRCWLSGQYFQFLCVKLPVCAIVLDFDRKGV